MTQWEAQLNGAWLLASQISCESGRHNRRVEQFEVDSKVVDFVLSRKHALWRP